METNQSKRPNSKKPDPNLRFRRTADSIKPLQLIDQNYKKSNRSICKRPLENVGRNRIKNIIEVPSLSWKQPFKLIQAETPDQPKPENEVEHGGRTAKMFKLDIQNIEPRFKLKAKNHSATARISLDDGIQPLTSPAKREDRRKHPSESGTGEEDSLELMKRFIHWSSLDLRRDERLYLLGILGVINENDKMKHQIETLNNCIESLKCLSNNVTLKDKQGKTRT